MRRGRPPYGDILTPREWQVLRLIRDGLTNEGIATRLGITLHGAKYHVSEILSKLGVSSREEAVQRAEDEERNFSGLPFMLDMARSVLTRMPAIALISGGIAATAAVLALFLINPLGVLGSGSSQGQNKGALDVSPDVSPAEGSDAISLAGLAGRVERRVTSQYPNAVLTQVDVGGGWTTFRFVVSATACEDPSDLASNLGHPDKCEVDATVSGLDAAAEQWQISRLYYSPLSVGVRPSIEWSQIAIGPRTVGVFAEKEWPGCTPRAFTLATVPGPQAWTVFCVQPDGGILRGTADPRTGTFSPEPGPVYPPAVATPTP